AVGRGGRVQRVPGGPLVVIGAGIGRGAVIVHLAVAGTGEGDEHRRAESLAIRSGVGFADRVRADLPLGQVGGVLAPAGGPLAARPGSARGDVAAQPRTLDFVVEGGDQLIQLAGVLFAVGGVIPVSLGLGAVLDPHRLHLIRWRRGWNRFGVQVPAFPALGGPELLGSFRARRADAGEGGPARDEHLVYFAGDGVGAAELDRAHAGAVV